MSSGWAKEGHAEIGPKGLQHPDQQMANAGPGRLSLEAASRKEPPQFEEGRLHNVNRELDLSIQ